jgi:hypothetical protein
MSQQQHKAIRSSGWLTDFIIGFPDGLLLLFFTTFLSQGLPLSVQQFYTINSCIWLGGSVIVMITAYLANKGDGQHDENTLSPKERTKLEHLDISDHIIDNIATEMARDAAEWEHTLLTEKVQESHYSFGRAIRGALMTGVSFLLGGILPLLPYLRNEHFSAAVINSVIVTFLVMIVFSFLKSRITRQSSIPLILRNLLYTTATFVTAYILWQIFK